MNHYPHSSVQSNQAEDSGAPGASRPSPALGQALARASQIVCQAQVLCDRAEAQISEGGESSELEGFVYALNLQLGLVGHLLDCAMRMTGDMPVRSSLAEWLAIGDIEAAVSNNSTGGLHA